MHSLDLGPEEVREALDPKNFPKRHVFLITMDGDIFVCDIDLGWMVFRRQKTNTRKEWSVALRAAISSMQYHMIRAKAVYDELKNPGTEDPEPEDVAKVLVFEKGSCPTCGADSDPEHYPFCCELHRKKGHDH